MLQNLKKRQQGFTIIEVMIVLVIAAVILLIVFLAVPALQRNSRNTQRKTEAARVAAAAGEWSANHGGIAPPSTANVEIQNTANITSTGQITSVSVGGSPSITNAVVNTNSTCVNGALTAGGARDIAITYKLESPGTQPTLCIASAL